MLNLTRSSRNIVQRGKYVFLLLTLSLSVLAGGCGHKAGEPPLHYQSKVAVNAPIQSMHFQRPMMPPALNTETYAHNPDNIFKDPLVSPLSTFSIDVDTASYSNVRRMINNDRYPVPGAVRVEEMINCFSYDYPQPEKDQPIAIYQELSNCPWNSGNQLLQIGLQAEKIDMTHAPQANLVFLLDVSGSMYGDLKLVKKSLKMLTKVMSSKDRISIVVYAGAAGMILPPTPASDKQTIFTALDNLEAGGSTAGGEGIELAYDLAEKHFIEGGNNRIILATDGDFNVGLTSEDALVRLITEKRKKGVNLSVLGFGMLNYDDVTSEALANHGNGNYAYIDNLLEAKKVLVDQVGATLVTVAKDVKIQVEFNPSQVKSYRLIGYENRKLNNEDFVDDRKDAGDMGAGHSVTVLYEIVPHDAEVQAQKPLRYQQNNTTNVDNNELAFVKYRYKAPDSDTSQQLSFTINNQAVVFERSSNNQRFTAAVAMWAMLLRDSAFKGNTNYDEILAIAKTAKGADSRGDRAEFIRLVELAKILWEIT